MFEGSVYREERHGGRFTGCSVSLTLWTFSLVAAMRSLAFWSCPPAWTTCTSTSVSSTYSKAVFIVSRDTAAGSPAVPSRWRSGHFLSWRRCVLSRSDHCSEHWNALTVFSLPKCDEKYHIVCEVLFIGGLWRHHRWASWLDNGEVILWCHDRRAFLLVNGGWCHDVSTKTPCDWISVMQKTSFRPLNRHKLITRL